MPRPRINLHQKVRGILENTEPLEPEADCPIRHFERSANAGHALLKYIDEHIDASGVYQAVYDRHLTQLRRMVLAELIESFERFLKELAAVCIDFLAPYSADDRFDELVPRGNRIGAFVSSRSIGKALCESDTWIKNSTINDRFRALLQDHFGKRWENLFPGPSQQPDGERDHAQTLAILWQIRHNLAHNLGVLTHSDSMRFRILISAPVGVDCRLVPTTDNLRFVKQFLTETAENTNRRVGDRLALILTSFHRVDPGLFDAQEKANDISRRFAVELTVDGQIGAS